MRVTIVINPQDADILSVALAHAQLTYAVFEAIAAIDKPKGSLKCSCDKPDIPEQTMRRLATIGHATADALICRIDEYLREREGRVA